MYVNINGNILDINKILATCWIYETSWQHVGYMNYWKTLLIFIGKYGIQTSLHTVEQCSKPSVAPVFCFVNGVNRDSHHGVC